MNIVRFLLAAVIGSIVGVLAGAFGLGGSSLMLPFVLLTGLITDYKTAVGTLLLTMVAPTSILAVYEYYENKKLDIPVAIILIITATIFGYFGAKINAYYNRNILEGWTGFIFIFIGIYFLWRSQQKTLNFNHTK